MDSDTPQRENPTSAKTGQMWGTDNMERLVRVRYGPPAYKSTQAQARVGRNLVNTNILVNSGIIVTYSIQNILDAIERAK
jgi:hypothetical protein